MGDLNHIDLDAIPFFSLNGMTLDARVVSIYDGDTVTVAMKYNNDIWKFHVRLSGIDSAEIKSKDLRCKEKGLVARNYLFNLITGEHIAISTKQSFIKDYFKQKPIVLMVECHEFDKYGRLLGRVFKGDMCLNDEMLKSDNALPYFGKTKMDFV